MAWNEKRTKSLSQITNRVGTGNYLSNYKRNEHEHAPELGFELVWEKQNELKSATNFRPPSTAQSILQSLGVE